jgi:hypothetical protein
MRSSRESGPSPSAGREVCVGVSRAHHLLSFSAARSLLRTVFPFIRGYSVQYLLFFGSVLFGGSSPYFQAITFTVPSRVPTGWMDIIILYSVHGNNIYTNPETPDSMYGVRYKHPYMTSQSQLLASGPSPAADLGFKA